MADSYLAARGLQSDTTGDALRFHPRCYYHREDQAPGAAPITWPALLAKVTDLDGALTGLSRTWLDPTTAGKAPVSQPRKAMGHLLGHGVRFGQVRHVLAVGEGLETMLSVRSALPALPVIAALSASHLAALTLPDHLERLYIAVDNDPPGHAAAASLADRAQQRGIETIRLMPRLGDFNDDLRAFRLHDLRAHLHPQLSVLDIADFLGTPAG